MSKKLLLLLALTVPLGVSVFYVWKQSTVVTPPSPEPVVTPEPISEPAPSDQPIDTSDWKTYRNEEYGFEFKLPFSWKLSENKGDIIYAPVVSLVSPESRKKIEEKKMDYSCDLSFYYYKSLKDVIDNTQKAETIELYLSQNDMVENIKKTKMGGFDAYEATFGGNGAYYGILSLKNSHVYQAFSCYKPYWEQLNPTERKIIESFRFVDVEQY